MPRNHTAVQDQAADGDRDDQMLGPERHAVRVEFVYGDWWGFCSCGANSLPMVLEIDARWWLCPRMQAEIDVLAGQRALARAERLAQFGPRR